MPQMSNITVKKADGTTDLVYLQQTASAGDKSPAVWKATSALAPLFRPELRVHSEWNGPKTARRVIGVFVYPFIVTGSDGKQAISDKEIGRIEFTSPQGIPSADADEGAVQFANLVASTLFKEILKTGYAPV